VPALAAPRSPVLRFRSPADRVEVDLDRQVLYVVHDGRIARILPVSSGNGETYRQKDGSTARALTPIGTYRVQRRIVGVRNADLGTLYDPQYFYRGWAIHGSNSVPAVPASHGCVRVTRADAKYLLGAIGVGTTVHLYGGRHVFSAGSPAPGRAPRPVTPRRGRLGPRPAEGSRSGEGHGAERVVRDDDVARPGGGPDARHPVAAQQPEGLSDASGRRSLEGHEQPLGRARTDPPLHVGGGERLELPPLARVLVEHRLHLAPAHLAADHPLADLDDEVLVALLHDRSCLSGGRVAARASMRPGGPTSRALAR
jgi:hypothetical protein